MLQVRRIHDDARVPQRSTLGAAGYDLSSVERVKVSAGGRALVPTGLKITVPEGTYGRIAPRSGLAWNHGIDVGAGVIDRDYAGEVCVILFNHDDADFVVEAGDRVAQLVLEKIVTPDVWDVIPEDEYQNEHVIRYPSCSDGAKARGAGGFGHTG